MTPVIPEAMLDEEDDDDGVEELQPPQKKLKTREWVIGEDIQTLPQPDFVHAKPHLIRTPYEYFSQFFNEDLINHIVYQTNLYARQKDVCSTFVLDPTELRIFIGVVLYMGVCQLPSIDDYWAVRTRVPQVADYMSKNRFRQIRSTLHFNDNEQAKSTKDRFYKIRPVFTLVTKAFLQVPATPVNSIDEVMVAYKGGMAGNLRQYIANKPDKWGFKLFCRASVDGFIHDILMYQGEATFSTHHTQLSEEENKMKVTMKTVVVLVKTVHEPNKSSIYADNFFTSLELAEYLKTKYNCRYVGTARENRIGYPPLKSVKDMEKKNVPRGELNYCSSQGMLVARWKDNKIVTILSSDAGIEPTSHVLRYDKTTREKKEVPCPDVIKKYNARMGGIDKSDMLTHLYKTPMRTKRYYMKLFGYILDLITCNAWILFKRDCMALNVTFMPLKDFRLDVSSAIKSQRAESTRLSRGALERSSVPLPKRGQRADIPNVAQRQDATKLHLPTHVKMRQTCKHCSNSKNIHRSRWMCETCKVALCLTDQRNCFEAFHKNL